MLAGYAVHVEYSRGRRFLEPQHPYRNDFQRDRDRVIHARAFRRLEAKTQVFTRRYSDHFRNRLTHTLEVSQISRTIAGALNLNVDLAEALALVHDIGHPPFGHSGEKALDAAMREHGFSFDHNLHALRIVEDFEQRYAAFRGLNLTFEVREGIIKHSRDYNANEHPELAEYLLDQRPPLEAQLIDLTDEIAYNTADLDDGFSARLFTTEQVAAEVPRYAEIYETVEQQFPGAAPRERFYEALRQLIDAQVSGLIEGTLESAAQSGAGDADAVRESPRRLAAFTGASLAASRALKSFLHRRVYSAPALEDGRRNSTAMMAELFAFFLSHPDRLPDPYRQAAALEAPHRLVCDYIAGMTDSFFRRTYEQVLGPIPPGP